MPWLRVLPSLLLVLIAAPANSQAPPGEGSLQNWGLQDFSFGGLEEKSRDPVAVDAQFIAATRDRPAIVMITAHIDPGWHVYSLTQPRGGPMRTRITLPDSPNYRLLGDFRSFPEPKSHVDHIVWNGLAIEEHENQVTWYAPIELAAGVDPQQLAIPGKVSLQACQAACIPLRFDFAAKLGNGVEIGPLDLVPPASQPVGGDARVKTPGQTATNRQPPSQAGVFRAEDSVVTWYGWLDHSMVEPGGQAHLFLQAKMPRPWHINAYAKSNAEPGDQPTLLAIPSLASSPLTVFQPIPESPVVEKASPIPSFGPQRYHDQVALWRVPIEVSPTAKPGEYRVRGNIGYQACEAATDGLGSCELSKGMGIEATLQVGSSTTAQPTAVIFTTASYKAASQLAAAIASDLRSAPPVPSDLTSPNHTAATAPEDQAASVLKQAPPLRIIEFTGSASSNVGLAATLGAALVGGLLLNLMPCVLPVLGLKIMSFAKQGGESRMRVMALNLTYVGGLLAVFMLLATLASLTQLGLADEDLGWGELNTLTPFKVGMTALVFAMALSFLGVWEIPIPGFAGTKAANDLAAREGFAGAFFKGIITTLLATPCSGPFLGPVFAFTLGQSPALIYLIFFCVGLGMATPYLLAGAFPSLLGWIPKPGAWMETFKQLMAFVLLATVVYLFSTIHEQYAVATLSLLLAIGFACWFGGRQPLTVPISQRAASWLLGLGVISIVSYLAFRPHPEQSSRELVWQPYTPSALAMVQAEGKTALVDFTADWCLTCQWNLATAIEVPEVEAVVAANDVALLKADYTDQDAAIKLALNQLRSNSIPLLAIYPVDRPGEVILLRDTVTKTEVLQALSQAGATSSNPQHLFRAGLPSSATAQASHPPTRD